MKRHPAILAALCAVVLGFIASPAQAAEPASTVSTGHKPIRVACVGDSLTSGFKMEHPETDSYPAQLARLLGAGWEVKSFAVPGRTALRDTERPLWKEKVFAEAQAWQPEEVILCLGTNDSWPEIWQRLSGAFPGDYRAMIDLFAALPSHPRIWLCLPPPLFIDNGEVQKSILTREIMPIIKRIGAEAGCGLIDWYAPLLPHGDLFMADKVHPLPAAAGIMAQIAADAIRQAPQVTSPASDSALQSGTGGSRR